MALMDLVPVLLFVAGVIVLAGRFGSVLFVAGAVVITVSGLMKVLWKFVLGVAKKDIGLLNRQLRFMMPGGFALCIIALVADRDRWSLAAVCRHVISMPQLIFFVLMIVCMGLMFYLGRHNDTRDARANWIEQGTNILMQLSFLMVVL